jgi:hypothetical protein
VSHNLRCRVLHAAAGCAFWKIHVGVNFEI